MPCCGWRILSEADGLKLVALTGFRWLDGARAPRLGETGFASIFFDDLHHQGRAIFSAPKIAMRCRLPDTGAGKAR